MAISIKPPNISALWPMSDPSTFPSITPNVTMVAVANPIKLAASRILTSINARLIPTAIASILVPKAATASL